MRVAHRPSYEDLAKIRDLVADALYNLDSISKINPDRPVVCAEECLLQIEELLHRHERGNNDS